MSATLQAIRELALAGRHAEAERALVFALQHAPDDAEAWALRAWNAYAAGQRDATRHALDRALALAPEHAAALSLATTVALADRDLTRARGMAERLVALHPDEAHAHFNLGLACFHAGDLDAAERALTRALERAPAGVDARLARAAVRLAREDPAAAAGDYEAASMLDAARVDAWLGLGISHLRRFDGATARPAFERALALAPKNADAWRGLAEAADLAGANDDALAARERELALRPADVPARLEYAMSLARAGRIEAARAATAVAAQLAPERLLPGWLELQLLPFVHHDASAPARWCQHWRHALARFEALDTADPAVRAQLPELLAAAPNFYRHYLGGDLTADQKRYGALLTRWADACAPSAPPARPHRRSGRLRIGFASAHLRRHTITKLFGRWITDLDRARFEVIACNVGPTEDAVTRALAARADGLIGPLRSVPAWIQALHGAELDALVWLDIGMDGTTQALAPLRFAPLQAVAWGHPVTTGLDSIDLFLSAAAMEPAGAQAHYSERLVRLPNLGIAYEMPAAARGYQRAPRDASRPPRFLCVQSAYKLTPQNLDLFARLAARVPAATFDFVPHPSAAVRGELSQTLAERFAHHGARYDGRVTLHPYQTEAQFMQRLREADVLLDTLGWSGGNTTLEALAFDLPVVTLPGEFMRARHTHGILGVLDLAGELSARDEAHYLDIAANLATDDAFHSRITTAIAGRKPRLYDDAVPVDALGDCLGDALGGVENSTRRT